MKKREIKKTKGNKLYLILGVLLLVALLLNIYLVNFKNKEVKEPAIQDITEEEILKVLAVDDYDKVQVNVTLNGLFLTSRCKSIIMGIEDFQAYSINQGINKKVDFRPTVHDLIEDILQTFNMKVFMVKISNMEDGTYYSNLILKQGGKILNLDAKPSDAIAVAVREDAPVYVKKSLLEEFGVKIC